MARGQQDVGMAIYSDGNAGSRPGNALPRIGLEQRAKYSQQVPPAQQQMPDLWQQMAQQIPFDMTQFQLNDAAFVSQALEQAFAKSVDAPITSVQQKRKKGNQRRVRPNHSFNGWNVRLNAKICQVSESGDLWELLDLVESHHSEMNIVNLSTILHRVARMAKKANTIRALSGHPQIARLRLKVLQELEKGSDVMQVNDDSESLPRCLATIAWSYATLQFNDAHSFQLIAKLATTNLISLKAFELANLLWSFAKVHIQSNELFEASMHCIPLQLDHFTPVSLSMVTWAYVTLHSRPPLALLRRLSGAFVEKVSSAKSQEIANMCWALATAKMARPNVFQVLGSEAARKLANFNVQELSNTAWAFSRAGLMHAELFEAMTNLFIQKPDLAFRFHGQALANMMWSLAKQVALGGGTTSKFQGTAVYLMPACPQVLDRFKPLEFSSMLWSIAKLGFKLGNNQDADYVFQAASQMEAQRLNMLSVQGLTNVLYAFAEYINGSASYIEFLGTLTNSILNRFREFEVIGLLYVVESLHTLLSQGVPVMNLEKLTFLVTLEVLKHMKHLNPFILTRLVNAAGCLSMEMKSTIAQIIGVQGEAMGMTSEELMKLCRDLGDRPGGQVVNDPNIAVPNRRELIQKMVQSRAAADIAEAFTSAASQDTMPPNFQSKKTKGEPMFVPMPRGAARPDVGQKQRKGGEGGKGKGGKGATLSQSKQNLSGHPQGGDLQGPLVTRTSGHRMAQKQQIPRVQDAIAMGQFVQPEARHLDGQSLNGGIQQWTQEWSSRSLERQDEAMYSRSLERQDEAYMAPMGGNLEYENVCDRDDSEDGNEHGYGYHYQPTDDERSEPSEYGDTFSNMRIVTPDIFGGSWDTSSIERNTSLATTPAMSASGYSNGSDGNFGNPSQIAQQLGAARTGMGTNFHFDASGAQPDQGGKGGRGLRPMRPLPARLNRLALQRNPGNAQFQEIIECEEENFVSFHSDRGKEEFRGHQSHHSEQGRPSFQRPSWADEDPADDDIAPLFQEWNESHPSLSRED